MLGYQLLSGKLPHDPRGLSLIDAAERIRNEAPVDLRQRGGVPADLSLIVATALAKEPNERYQSAGALAADLRRYLRDEAIQARPAKLGYLLRRFARRHRRAVISATLLVIVGIGVSIALVLQALEIREARDEAVDARAQMKDALDAEVLQRRKAVREAEVSRAALGFTSEILLGADPLRADGQERTLRWQVERAASLIEKRLGHLPRARTHIEALVGQVFTGLGDLERAEPHLLTALRERQESLGADDPLVAVVHFRLARLRFAQGRFEDSERSVEEARRIFDLHPEANTLESTGSLDLLARLRLRQNRIDDARALVQQASSTRERRYGAEAVATIEILSTLADIEIAARNWPKAEEILKTQVRRFEAYYEGPSVETAQALGTLAYIAMHSTRWEDALELLEDSIEHFEGTIGHSHGAVATIYRNLGITHSRLDEPDESDSAFATAMRITANAEGIGNPRQLDIGLAQFTEAQQRERRKLLARIYPPYFKILRDHATLPGRGRHHVIALRAYLRAAPPMATLEPQIIAVAKELAKLTLSRDDILFLDGLCHSVESAQFWPEIDASQATLMASQPLRRLAADRVEELDPARRKGWLWSLAQGRIVDKDHPAAFRTLERVYPLMKDDFVKSPALHRQVLELILQACDDADLKEEKKPYEEAMKALE